MDDSLAKLKYLRTKCDKKGSQIKAKISYIGLINPKTDLPES
jgi:hypothetical protein